MKNMDLSLLSLSVKKIHQYIFLGTELTKYGINRQTIVPYLRTGFQHVRYGTIVGGFHLWPYNSLRSSTVKYKEQRVYLPTVVTMFSTSHI